jgi:hypothetical protein
MLNNNRAALFRAGVIAVDERPLLKIKEALSRGSAKIMP